MNKENMRILRHQLRKLGFELSRKRKIAGIAVNIIIPEHKVAVIIDPCTNGCGCPEHYMKEEEKDSPWGPDPTRCMARMERESHRLSEIGWIVVRIWEHDLDRSIDFVLDVILENMEVRKKEN